MNTTNGAAILSPEDVAALLVQPVLAESLPGLVATPVPMTSNKLRAPSVQDDPNADWVEEGAEITASDAVFDEVEAPARKVAGLTIVTSELANDSSPSAVEQIGEGLKRDIIRKVNKAFVLNLAAPAPAGLGSVTGATVIPVGTAWANEDPFVDAVAAASGVGANIDSWIVSAADYVALRKLKTATGSNQRLITPDAGGGILIEGRPVHLSPDLPAGTAWGVPRDRVLFGVREDAEVVADSSAYFSSDRVGVRAKMRATFAFNHPAALVKLTVGA
ncbi:phage major capsid protein [Dietzia sp. CW19]|uniref:phage major capsid protein n=1 Tax=Dietzia sp. CW19 TaxID=1630634 RepID=UPI0015FD4BBF|nr:phage major capsid protein [Dietzia sp. CW19]MBB1052462.1 phage major capsid protein [Dietzia sp. CW19]